MKSHAEYVIIGGGIVGLSIAYHLAKLGKSDVALLERRDLTHGSTWHAAGLLPLFNMSYSVGQLHKYSIDLYQRLQEETGQGVSFHKTGNLRLAKTKERMDEYLAYCGTANTIGVPFEVIGPDAVAELWPLAKMDGIIGALFHPDDGHVAPVDVAQALARGARDAGVEINRSCEVTAIARQGGKWQVSTGLGDIQADTVITATGSWARQVAAMVGLDIPVVPVEHQYIITEPVPELLARKDQGLAEMPVLRESDESYYLREEVQGLIVGPYEQGAKAWAADGVPAAFGRQLLTPDLERLDPYIEAAIERVPMLGEVGIRETVNGPIPYTPDGSPLIGPAYGLPGFWLAEGFSFGITAAGGAGKVLAEWIVGGEPSMDMLAMDPRRFGAYASRNYAVAKNVEAYENVFTIHFPDEERPAARPARTSPIHDKLDRAGAVWGQRYGWERPNWFAGEGEERRDHWSFRRSNYFNAVGRECRAVRDAAGLIDITSFSKFRVTGAGAEAFLDRLVANRLPQRDGRIALAHALTPSGGVRSEFTIMRDGPEAFFLVSSGAAERYDHDLLLKESPADGSVTVENITTGHGVLVLAGPASRDILRQVTETDLSSNAFPWLSGQMIEIGAARLRAMRVNFVGELGWELHHPIETQHAVFDALMAAGRDHGLQLVGMRAMDSLRLEKSYRMWGQDLTTQYTPLEASLDRFARLDKGDFTGRAALEQQRAEGVPNRFVTLAVAVDDNDPDGPADPHGNEPIYRDGRMVGRATAGGYGHALGQSLALAYVEAGAETVGTKLEIDILGKRVAAVVIAESPHDPDNARLRA